LYKPKLGINCKLVPHIKLVDWNVVPGSTKDVDDRIHWVMGAGLKTSDGRYLVCIQECQELCLCCPCRWCYAQWTQGSDDRTEDPQSHWSSPQCGQSSRCMHQTRWCECYHFSV